MSTERKNNYCQLKHILCPFIKNKNFFAVYMAIIILFQSGFHFIFVVKDYRKMVFRKYVSLCRYYRVVTIILNNLRFIHSFIVNKLIVTAYLTSWTKKKLIRTCVMCKIFLKRKWRLYASYI